MTPIEALTYWQEVQSNALRQAANAGREIELARQRMGEAVGHLVAPIQFLVGEEGQGEV